MTTSDPSAVLAAIKARCEWDAIEQVAWEAYPRFDSDRGKRIAFRAGAEYLRPDLPLLADALQAVLDEHKPRLSMMSPWVCVNDKSRDRCYGEQACSPGCHFTDKHSTICAQDHTEWPCDDYRIITTALAKGETS